MTWQERAKKAAEAMKTRTGPGGAYVKAIEAELQDLRAKADAAELDAANWRDEAKRLRERLVELAELADEGRDDEVIASVRAAASAYRAV